ncbi:MAG: hypothetical protein HY765_03985 [Rhodomicrobium sp.]|nr:hypothetical protein [Rhodomicrobium sp.]
MKDLASYKPPSLSQVSGSLGFVKWIVAAIAVLYVLRDSYFIVQPTEMAGVRRLGTVRTKEPLLPGFYLKAPFIDQVDKLQVSIDTLRLFAKRNTVKISEEREQIAGDVRGAVSQSVRELFGVDIFDLQIPAIKYSDTFVTSVEAAVKAKNDAIAAENTVNRIRYEGEQTVVTARAEAEAQIARAQAQKQARILEAEGEARGIELRAAAEAQGIKVRGEALKENERVIDLTLAERWTGHPPQTILGDRGAVPFFNIGPAVPAARPAQR